MPDRNLAVAGLSAVLLLSAPQAALAQEPVAGSTVAPADEAGANDAYAGDPPPPDLIVVTGAATPVERGKIGSSLTIIDGEVIARANIAYLADALRQVPGLAVTRTGSFGAPTQVRIRGGEGNHTLVLIDGIEVSSIGEGEFDFASLLANNIERVEVLRGPQSGLYGSNALAGVINVITSGGDGPAFDASLEAGSFGTFMGRAALSAGDRENFVMASGIFRSTDGISTAAIGNEEDGDRNLTAYARGGLELSPAIRLDGSLRHVDTHTDTDGFDFSGGPNQGLAIDDDSFSGTDQWSGGLALTARPADGVEAALTASYTDNELTGGSGRVATFGNVGRRLDLSGRFSFRFASGPALGHALTAFVDHEEEEYRNTFPSDPSQVAEQSRQITGLGAEYRLDLLDAVFLKAALRHDGNSRFADATSYGLAASWVLGGGTRLHASYGKGVTNPTFFEQFGFIPAQFVGNPKLTPEAALGFDIGVEQRLGDRLVVDATYFRATLEDEIVSQFPTVVNDVGESDREGVELYARVELGQIRLGGSYTYLDATDPDGTREVRRPEHHVSFDASADFGPERRATIDLGLLYNGEVLDNDFRDYFSNGFIAEKTRLDDYLLVRLAGSWRLTTTIQLFGRVENLLDAEYREAISYGTPGLSAYAGVRVTLN